jgi:hypothetical protein
LKAFLFVLSYFHLLTIFFPSFFFLIFFGWLSCACAPDLTRYTEFLEIHKLYFITQLNLFGDKHILVKKMLLIPLLTKHDSAQNKTLATAQYHNRVFVSRGSQIGIFKCKKSGNLEYINNVPAVKVLKKNAFTPAQMLLHDKESKMLLLNTERSS